MRRLAHARDEVFQLRFGRLPQPQPIDPEQQFVVAQGAEERQQQRPAMLTALGVFGAARPVRASPAVRPATLTVTALGARPHLTAGCLPSAGVITGWLEIVGTSSVFEHAASATGGALAVSVTVVR